MLACPSPQHHEHQKLSVFYPGFCLQTQHHIIIMVGANGFCLLYLHHKIIMMMMTMIDDVVCGIKVSHQVESN